MPNRTQPFVVDAAYLARELWSSHLPVTEQRIRKAQKRAEQYGIAWADVEALQPAPAPEGE